MFKFKLQPVLTFRKREEEEKMLELALINAELLATRNTISDYSAQRSLSAKKLTEISRTEKDINLLKLYQDFILGRDSDILNKNAEMKEISGRLEEKQKELIEYVKRRRAMEIYRDKLKKTYHEEEKRKERIIDDEAVTHMWYREAL